MNTPTQGEHAQPQIDWSQIGLLIEAHSTTREFVTGTTNWAAAICKYMAERASHGQAPAGAALFDEQGFRDWVLRNLPDETIIGNGSWWADHLTGWAKRFIKAAPTAQPAPASTIPNAALADLHEGLAAKLHDGPARNLHLETAAALRAPAAGAVAGWLPVHFNGHGFYGAPLKTEAEANQYIEQVHKWSDNVTLIARPFAWVDAAPTPAAQGDAEDAADPLQGAANWLAQAHGQFGTAVLQGCLMIGYNRAKRLHDAALAQKEGNPCAAGTKTAGGSQP